MYDIKYLTYNKPSNHKYETFSMDIKIGKRKIIKEYYPAVNSPTSPVRYWLKKLELWYNYDELNSFDNHGYQNDDQLYCDLNGFYRFYGKQR